MICRDINILSNFKDQNSNFDYELDVFRFSKDMTYNYIRLIIDEVEKIM